MTAQSRQVESLLTDSQSTEARKLLEKIANGGLFEALYNMS
jgi:hypothetical protein